MIRRLLLVALLVVVGGGCAPPGSMDREPLTQRNLDTPRFDPLPPSKGIAETSAGLVESARGPSGFELLIQFVPSQGHALWIALIVMLMVAFNFSRPSHPRNIDLLAMLGVGVLLFGIMRFFEFLQDPVLMQLMDWVFIGIMAFSLFVLSRALIRLHRPHADAWRPNLPRRALIVLTVVLLTLNVLAGVLRTPDDAGFYTNLGAQRLRERGMFPYGDPLLSQTPGATYGPVLYLSHLAYQLVLVPTPQNPPEPLPPVASYLLPPDLASRLATVTFHLFGVAGLIIAARRLVGVEAAWGVAALYCGSAYVMGVGGEHEFIGGMTFVSHIAPAAVAMLAFAALPRPFLAGGLLAFATATLFYPAFFFPAWLGHYWPSRFASRRFVIGFAVVAALIGGPILLRSEPIEGRGLVSTLLHETQGHQQHPDAYGSSPFGFWGQRGGVRAILREPIWQGHPNTSPAFLLFAAFVVGSFFLARGRSELQLALLTGALGIGAQLWKVHGTGVYVTWYYGFLLLGFLGHWGSTRGVDAVDKADPPTRDPDLVLNA